MPHLVTGALKDYDWGIVDGLERWSTATGAAQAELWFGTHPGGPTVVVDGPDTGRLLSDLPEHQGMPLVKLLAAAGPLSLQVHPDASRAALGWGQGSALYADNAEKAEMLVAIEDFDYHAGWRDAQSAADVLAAVGVPDDVVALVRSEDRAGAIRGLLSLDAVFQMHAQQRLVPAARAAGWDPGAVSAMERVAAAHPADPGVLVTVLLEHGVLHPGEGLAVSAGVVHSYVAGLGVEVMTSSDNVLRLGLSHKPIAVEEALAAVREDRTPTRMSAALGRALSPEGMPFDLQVLERPLRLGMGRHRIVLPLRGRAWVTGLDGQPVEVVEGRAMVWSPMEPDIDIEPEATTIVVTGAVEES